MAKKAFNLLKKVGKAYMKGVMELYGPALNCGLHPFI